MVRGKAKIATIVLFLLIFINLTVVYAAGDRTTPYRAWTNHQFTLQQYGFDTSKKVELQLLEFYKGTQANSMISSESSYNKIPASDEEWLLMKFNMKYVSGPEQSLSASDIIFSDTGFYTKNGVAISPLETAYFSRDLNGLGEFDVSFYPGGQSVVWYGILVKKTVGYPLIRIGTGYDSTEYSTIYKWFSTEPNEKAQQFVTRLYQLSLNRNPDAVGLNYWMDELISKTQSGADAAHNFIFSPEFIAKNVTDGQFIDIMYKAFFDRGADDGGKAYWMDKLNSGMSRLYVFSCFVNSSEFSNICTSYGIERGTIKLTKPADVHPEVAAFTYRFYDKCMGRKPDDLGLNYWVDKLVKGESTGASISQDFVFSPEFISKNLSNTDFVSIMYRVFFNREPDSAGQTYWVNTLKAGKSRIDVLSGFVSSKEFATICNSYGIQVGTIKK